MVEVPEDAKLELCPFCGGDDAKLVDATRILGSWKVVHRCKAVGYLCVETSDRERAIADWNHRPARQDPDIRRLALEEAAKVAASMYVRDAFRFEFGNDVAAAIRALKEAGHG